MNLHYNTAAKDNKLQLDHKVSKRKSPLRINFSPRFCQFQFFKTSPLRNSKLFKKILTSRVYFLREVILDLAGKILGYRASFNPFLYNDKWSNIL